MKFKVGDKVKVSNKTTDSDVKWLIGKEGTVIKTPELLGAYFYDVLIDGRSEYFTDDELGLVERQMKLFIVTPKKVNWDDTDGMVVLAEDKDEAISIARNSRYNFDEIEEIEEVDTTKSGFVFESVKWG